MLDFPLAVAGAAALYPKSKGRDMRWQGRRESSNVEDRRGMGVGGGAGLGCGGLLLLLVISYITGTDPLQLLQQVQQTEQTAPRSEAPGPAPSDSLGKFASVVLADTEDTWDAIFKSRGQTYEAPRLVLFSNAVRSACGLSSAAVGPFYCPPDQTVYIDLSFFNELGQRFGAPGDFAQAYVIAHEVGHHVQNLTGVAEQVSRAQQNARSQAEANQLSVRLELHADCLAGVWAHHAHRERQLLEPGDVEEGLNAAAAIGDDRLQDLQSGQVQPESWTHGSSEQRVGSLRRGIESGDPAACKGS
jgi:predicted metalloprotease